MKTLGIFGDSFADPSHGHDDYPEDRQYGWPYLLSDSYDVKIFARGGSSIYYAYKQFLDHHDKYDKVIVLLTGYERLPQGWIQLPDRDNTTTVPSFQQAEYYLEKYKNELDPNAFKKLKALRDFYLWADDEKIAYDIASLMVDKIKFLRPDALLINCYYTGGRLFNFPEVNGPSMIEYLDAMIRGMVADTSKFPHRVVQGVSEMRLTCHFSKETNIVVAQDMFNALTTGIWNPTIPYAIPHEIKDLDYYYGKRLWQ